MSDFWSYEIEAIDGDRVRVRVGARSWDCGERFPLTLDWMARSLSLASPDAESLLERDLEDPDDRATAAFLSHMSMEPVGRLEPGANVVGQTAIYTVTVRDPRLLAALAVGDAWTSPCFDQSPLAWRLRSGRAWTVVLWEEGSWGAAPGLDEDAAWTGWPAEATEDGGWDEAQARVDEALAEGAILSWQNHAAPPEGRVAQGD